MIFLKKTKLILLFSLVLFSISCSKDKERSRLVVQFDSKSFNSQKASSLAAASSTNPNGPNWGLSDPQNIQSDIQCFGLFVYANETGMKESSCTSVSGNKFQFGPRAGFFPINSGGDMIVSSGEKRKIILMGMASSDGTCDSGFDKDPELRFSNYSHPFILGQAEVDLKPGDNTVEINLSNTFNSSNKIKTCDFIKPDGDDNSSPISHDLLVNFDQENRNKRKIWVENNNFPRTISFTHGGVSTQCSRDGGTSWEDCSTGSFIWNYNEYGDTHIIKAIYSDNTYEENTFIPSIKYPGLSFVTCNYNFSGSGGPADTITDDSSTITFSGASGAVTTANNVVCLSGGINITKPNTANSITNIANGVKIITRQGDSATLSNNDNNWSTISLNGKNGIYFVGINITCAGQGGSPAAILLNSSSAIEFQDVHIDEEGSQGPDHMIKLNGSYNVNGIRLFSTTINAYETGIYVAGADHLEIKGSTIEAKTNIYVSNATPTISVIESKLINNGNSISDRLASLSGTGSINFSLTNSKLIDNSGGGLYLSGANITFEMSGNTFRRTATATAGHNGPIISTNSSPQINSANDGNFFCHEDSGNASIASSIFNGSPVLNFDLDDQLNNGSPITCP